ncbi:MAG: winged helix-turn-helix transcriptional regulator [Alphaproteobacteria bacterium]|nr:winged helix-turn-helix transcriptional regulator [Alphaproteobacteria bacterium]
MDLSLQIKALADPARLRIVEFLRRPDAGCCVLPDRVCACDIEGLLGLSQPAISHHMKILTQAGLVSGEKQGRWMYYRLESARFADLVSFLQPLAAPPAASPPHARAA